MTQENRDLPLTSSKSGHYGDRLLGGKEKLDWMNAALAKAQVYTPLTQKKITALADIRNSAAHGKWTAFTQDDVGEMLKWTTDFLEKHDG